MVIVRLPLLLSFGIGVGALLAPLPLPAGGITGETAVSLVREAMAAVGLPAPQMAPPLRDLPGCAHPPQVGPRGGNWSVVELRCEAPQPWVRILRTGAAAAMAPPVRKGSGDSLTAPGTAPTLLAARPLTKGKRIVADDLVSGRIAGLAPALRLDTPELAIGRRLRVGIGAGQPITERHLEPALDVSADQQVTALLTASGIEITTSAIAATGGVVGDLIPLRSPSGGRETEGVIIAPGIVRVRPNMPRRNAVTGWKRRLTWSIPSHRTTSRACALLARSTPRRPKAAQPPAPKPRPSAERPSMTCRSRLRQAVCLTG